MIKTDIVQEMIFYDKDNIPDKVYKRLGYYLNKNGFNPEEFWCVSAAASAVCLWMIAIHRYSTIFRQMQPHLKNLSEAEEKFAKVRTLYKNFLHGIFV